MSATPAAFAKRVLDLIEDRCGRRTAYAYLHPPKGAVAVPEGTLKQWVSRRARPFTDALVTFAHEMRTTLDYLVLGRGPMTPGLSRIDYDLAAELRAYLVDSLSRRAATAPYDRGKKARFFEGFLPNNKALLDSVADLVWQKVEASHRERWERTRSEVLQVLLEKLQRAGDRRTKERLQAQIVAAVKSAGDVPLHLDEGAE